MILGTLILAVLAAPDTLSAATVTASFKEEQVTAVSSTRLGLAAMERRTVRSVKDVTALAPNFYQPDYGSHTTSSIYVRGFGSRIDQPVVGLYIDGVPVMNKSSYDFEFLDVRSLSVLRGPQSTLYGRNTSGGVVSVSTLTPFDVQGTAMTAEWSPAASGKASVRFASAPRPDFGYSVSAYFSRYDGDFINGYDGSVCDRSKSAGLRARLVRRGKVDWDNVLSAGCVDEGGYAYALVDDVTGESSGINYNDPCAYVRLMVTDALTAAWSSAGRDYSAAVSWQYLDDDMLLDNDFTALSLFTLDQSQKEHAVTVELQTRSAGDGTWRHLDGAFLFGKHLEIDSPVLFKRDGVDRLILDNANRGIGMVFPGEYLSILEDNFTIDSGFRIPTFGAAMYHSSKAGVGNWTLSAGVRLDLEHSAMRYSSEGGMSYLFSLTMEDFKPLWSVFEGNEVQTSFEILPSVSCSYSFGDGEAYLALSKGHKAGGFNTQLFSDILQNRMMSDMMTGIGFHPKDAGDGYSSAEHTKYKPESNWNLEAGTRLRTQDGLSLDLAAFLIECRNQQVTVMPPGNGTGRMMSNAGRSRSSGIEAAGTYVSGDFTFHASYGLTVARFIEYDYGNGQDYSGNSLPYAPRNTLDASVTFDHAFRKGIIERLTAVVGCRGAGRIWWDEANTLFQPYYSLLDASLSLRRGRYVVSAWGKNLLDEEYGTFRFRSVSKPFISMGRPRRIGIKLSIEI